MFDAWLDNLLYVQQRCGEAFPVNRVCTVSVTNRESHIQLHRLGCGMGRDLMSFHYQSQKQSMYGLNRRTKGWCFYYVAARNVEMFHCKRSLRKAARGQLLPTRNADVWIKWTLLVHVQGWDIPHLPTQVSRAPAPLKRIWSEILCASSSATLP